MSGPEVLFEQRARRGTERGADLVLAGARDSSAGPVPFGADEPMLVVASFDDGQRRPDDSETSPHHNRWMGVALGVAATILVVVGVAGLGDGKSDELENGPVASTGVTDPVPSPTVTDPLGYQWSRVPHDDTVFGSFGRNRTSTAMSGVTVGGPGLVAVGSYAWDDDGDWQIDDTDAVVWTSMDGLTWVRVPSDEAVFGGEGVQEMWSVTAGGPGLVAIGMDGDFPAPDGEVEEYGDATVWTSVDGLTWTRVPYDEEVFGAVAMNGVTAGGPGLVAVGQDAPDYARESNAVVWTSVDGRAWSRVPHDEATFGGAKMTDVAAGGPGLVAVGGSESGAVVWTSTDGLVWLRVPHGEEFTVEGDEGVTGMIDVTVGGPGLIAAGWDGYWTSVDGFMWTWMPFEEHFRASQVTVTESHLVAVGWKGLWISVDGLAWSPAPGDDWPPVPGLSSLVVGGPGMVVVGEAAPPGGCCGTVAAVWVGVER